MAHLHEEAGRCSSTFPVKTKQVAAEVNTIPTELVYNQFSDKIFIIATQYQKIGNLVSITVNTVVDETGVKTPIRSTQVLLGNDEPLTHVIAKNLVASIEISKPVILSFALKDTSPQCVKSIAKLLSQLTS